MLPQISTPATIGKVSGFGWGMGYLGGILALAIVLFTLVTPIFPWAGASETDCAEPAPGRGVLRRVVHGLRFAGALCGARRSPASAGGPRFTILQSYRELWRRVVALARADRHTVYFLLASAVFRDGLAAVFTFGGIIAAGTFGFPLTQVIIFAIVGNVVAATGAMIGGMLDDRIGPKRVIVISLVGLLVAGLGVFFSPAASGFWIFGLLLCLFVGPAQASSRAYLARLAPAGQEGELFGLYATTGRAVSFLAPALFAAPSPWPPRTWPRRSATGSWASWWSCCWACCCCSRCAPRASTASGAVTDPARLRHVEEMFSASGGKAPGALSEKLWLDPVPE